MKTIGLIGGISWESTALYYQLMNRKVKELMGGHHSCQCLLFSVEFNEVLQLQHQDNWDQIGEQMVEAAKRLKGAGADLLVVCSNTMHKVAGQIEKGISLSLVHIADVTAAEIKKQGLSRVGLLGTKFTMEQDFLKDRLRQMHGIETLVPGKTERETVHRIIYEELANGIIREGSRHAYLEIIGQLAAQGAEGIILGCTEIGLLISQAHTPTILFDTARIHAEKAVELALTDETVGY